MQNLTLIGIGSSAGGLEAIRDLVSTLPTDLPVSYVVVQHMSPHHKSLMTELVAQQTELIVKDVVDGAVPEQNTVYITPPKTDVIFVDGKLRLVEPSPEAAMPKPSVDRFLSSVAAEHGEKSVGIILSGTGSDGSYGVQAIREAGGITIAQDEESAKYDGMPNAAVQTGCVDLILAPSDIGTHLQKILSSPRDFSSFRQGLSEESPITDLLHILLARSRVDFRDYKQTTINRRIERRMVALGISSKSDYTELCRNNPQAVDALFKDLLISVTRFFRDPEEFESLKQFLPSVIKDAGDRPLRIWVAGCATGEEAYSIAMLVCDALGGPTAELKSKVQIFATDIDKDALNVARRGIYASAVLNDIPAKLAQKYVVKQGDSVRVIENLRNAVLFSEHNVCQDPPFQKVDLICCRNLLIYFVNSLQQKVMSRFHYALSPNGILFLGTAESVAGSDELFIQERGASHFFRKRVLKHKQLPTFKLPNKPLYDMRTEKPQTREGAAQSTDSLLFEALAQSLGKNSILVSDDFLIARVFGSVGQFLDINESSSLKMHLDLLRSPLRQEARSLITIAFKQGESRSGIQHVWNEETEEGVQLDVFPIIAKSISERAALVVFTMVKLNRKQVPDGLEELATGNEVMERVLVLENELANTREAHQQTIEQLETSNEELQSLNEELQSTNEELQATNEELETSNEELQSTNEELITVNEELQVTASELNGRTGELTSILESTPLAILVTDSALQITQATRAASELFQIKIPLATPHISQCVLPEGYPSLAPLCSEALKLGTTVTHEFSNAGSRVKLNFSPYFDMHGQIIGVTIVSTAFPGLVEEMEMLLDHSGVMLIKSAQNGEILRASNRAAKMLGSSRSELTGKVIYDVLPEDASASIKKQDTLLLEGKETHFEGIECLHLAKDKDPVWVSFERFLYEQKDGNQPAIYGFATDVTDIVDARISAEEQLAQLELMQSAAGMGVWSYDIPSKHLYWSPEVYRIHRTKPQAYKPEMQSALEFYHEDDVEMVTKTFEKILKDGGDFKFEKRLFVSDGKTVKVESRGIGIKDPAGSVSRIVGVFREV
ncbi:MAG: chemotaxis protein CheB [Pseudomonadota bacterium]